MHFTGFADEAGGPDIDLQIKATKALGWRHIETRRLSGSNLAFISDAEFAEVEAKLAESGVSFNCYGSGIANWSKPITESPDSSYDELRRAIPRMQRLGIKLVRVMSFAVPAELKEKSWDFEGEVVKRLKVLAAMAQDAGIVCVHENCMNWGGLSFEHTLRLVERVASPSFKLVFDTGNPVVNDDLRGGKPYKKQSAWDFYKAVREHVVHLHIKDARVENGKDVFTFPGEGSAEVPRILEDLLGRGYDGGISIEPHMVRVFHDSPESQERNAALAFENYIEYGRRVEKMASGIADKLGRKPQ